MTPSSDATSTVSYAGGKLQVTNTNANGSVTITPTFDASTTQLSSVRVAADVSMGAGTEDAGLACRFNNGDRYAFVISTTGNWGIFKDNGPNAQQLQNGSVTAANSYHLQIECTGPETPAATDTVNLTFKIDTNTFSASDSTSPLKSGKVGLDVRRHHHRAVRQLRRHRPLTGATAPARARPAAPASAAATPPDPRRQGTRSRPGQ